MKSETTPQEIAQTTTIVKPVAIYCRVSTENQESEGTSLDTQRQACLKFCQGKGYQAIHQYLETTSGLTLDRPQLNELRDFVRSEEISGVVIYCLDRLSRDPTHGVILQEEFEKHNVTLEAVTETVESTDLGKLISYIRGYAAKLEAEKIRERTQRGIKARVFDKGLPVTYRQPFGYSWDKDNKRLVPNSDYDTVKLIINLAIDGKSYDYIIAELKRRGILSPTGLPEWNKHTLSTIVRNPLYAGKYCAFKSEAIEPRKRNSRTNGKSSVKRLPQDQWHYIPEIEVVNPPITLDQRALLLDQLQKRQKTAKRNAKRDYLLRGMVFCMTHSGKKGEPRVYHGQPYHNRWRYTCPVGKCDFPLIDGPGLESYVTGIILHDPWLFQPDEFYEALAKEANSKNLKKDLYSEIDRLQKEEQTILNKIVQLEDRWISSSIEAEIYSRLSDQYQAKRTYCKEQGDKVLSQLAKLKHSEQAAHTARSIKSLLGDRLHIAFLPFIEESFPKLPRPKEMMEVWLKLFDALNIRVEIYPTSVKGKFIQPVKIMKKRINIRITGEIFGTDQSGNIALPDSRAGLHNKLTYYPLRFSLPNRNTELASILAGVKAGE